MGGRCGWQYDLKNTEQSNISVLGVESAEYVFLGNLLYIQEKSSSIEVQGAFFNINFELVGTGESSTYNHVTTVQSAMPLKKVT